MKKLFTTLFIVLGFYSLSNAQRLKSPRGTTEFGIDVGYNSAYVVRSYGFGSNYTSGLNVGLSADHYFSDMVSLKVKVNYDQKGWRDAYVTSPQYVYNGVDFRLDYITVPVMANFHFGYTRNWYMGFGPYIGFLTSAKETRNDIGVSSAVNSVDGGFDFNIGFKVPISPNAKFFIEYDGQGGFANVFKYAPSSYYNIRNSFNVGVYF